MDMELVFCSEFVPSRIVPEENSQSTLSLVRVLNRHERKPSPRSGHACVADAANLYLYGGFCNHAGPVGGVAHVTAACCCCVTVTAAARMRSSSASRPCRRTTTASTSCARAPWAPRRVRPRGSLSWVSLQLQIKRCCCYF